jgi:hypothetical protein
MTRFVGGVIGIERTVRDAGVGGSAIGTTGTGEKAVPSKSETVDVGADGAGRAGTFGTSQSHRRQWQPGASAGFGAVGEFAG